MINDQGEILVHNSDFYDTTVTGLLRNGSFTNASDMARQAGLNGLALDSINNAGVCVGYTAGGTAIVIPYQLEIISPEPRVNQTQFTVEAAVEVPQWNAQTGKTDWLPATDGTQVNWSVENGDGSATTSQGSTQGGKVQLQVNRVGLGTITVQVGLATLNALGTTATTGNSFVQNTYAASVQQVAPGGGLPPLPVDDAGGPRYRKVALNGRPMPDEKPHQQPESDHTREESYVDALELTLHHSTTDVYVPVASSDLVLAARRNFESEIWNERHDLRVDERPDRPFGAGWTSGLAANIHFVFQQPNVGSSITQSADYAYVTDEDGSSYRFAITYPPDDPNHIEFFPLPNSNTEQESYYTSLKDTGRGQYTFTKKYGSTLNFSLVSSLDKTVPSDRLAPVATTYDVTHKFARLDTLRDRYGSQLNYSYTTFDSIIPGSISNNANPDQSIRIQRNGNLITGVADPMGNQTSYAYKTISCDYPFQVLTTVTGAPDHNGSQPLTGYDYDFMQDTDNNPNRTALAPCYHCDLKSITDPRQKTYSISWLLDSSRKAWSTAGIYTMNGVPRNVDTITLPNGIGQTSFRNHSYLCLQPDFDGTKNVAFLGHRATFVKDAVGNGCLYQFTNSQVITLNNAFEYLKPAQLTSPLDFAYMVVFDQMTITSFAGAALQFNGSPTDFSYSGGNPLGSETFTFDSSAGMALQSVKDFSGNTTSYAYTDTWTPNTLHPWYTGFYPVGLQGDPTIQTDAKGNTKTFHYGDYGTASRLLDQTVDEEKRTTAYTIDSLGRHTDEIISDPSGNAVEHTHLEYASSYPSFVTTKTIERLGTANDNQAGTWCTDLVTSYLPDGSGNVAKQTVDPNGQALATQFTYDLNNNKVMVTDPKTYVTKFDYDGRNQLYEVDYPVASGNPVQNRTFGYDANGNKIRETDENRHSTLFVYDALNRLTDTGRDMDGDGLLTRGPNSPDLVTSYAYNAVNSRLAVTDPRGLSTAFDYDALQRLQTSTDAQTQVTNYEYGLNSGASAFDSSTFKPTKVTDPRGHFVETTYDALYRPTTVTSSATPLPPGVTEPDSTVLMDYDNVGNPIHAFDPKGNVTTTTFDALNRSTRVDYADTTYTQTLYTSTGLKWKTINELLQETELHYDGAGRLTGALAPPPDPTAPTVRPLVQTAYDANSNVKATTDARLNEWDYAYDLRNRKTDEYEPAVADYDSGKVLQPHLSWEYDGVGNVVATTDARQNRTATLYDWANRPYQVPVPLVPAIQPDGSSAWVAPVTGTTYDADGHVLTLTDTNGHQTVNTYDTLNRLGTTTRATDAGPDQVVYGYDAVGNRISVRDGNLHTTGFGYDGQGRNVTLTDAAGNGTTTLYDELNKVSRLDANHQLTKYDGYDQRNRLTHVEIAPV